VKADSMGQGARAGPSEHRIYNMHVSRNKVMSTAPRTVAISASASGRFMYIHVPSLDRVSHRRITGLREDFNQESLFCLGGLILMSKLLFMSELLHPIHEA